MAPRNDKNKKSHSKRPIESYEHRDKERVNNPPVGLVTPETDPDAGQKKKRYAYDPHLDPQLVWAGKAEHTSFEVPTVSLHVHERIDPRTIIEAVRKRNGRHGDAQIPLFELERKEPLHHAIEFYKHAHNWTNRLIAGDSLLVMNSLLEKEGMAGKVQMIYIDPPYGIKYGSNFQPFVNKRDVKDGKDEDLTAEPEQIKAFRDTWELGIHSYLTYLRDRLLLARELLAETGSIFVQISDENVHHVRELMDEVFGAENFVSVVVFKTTTARTAKYLNSLFDFLLWYAKEKIRTKYLQLFQVETTAPDDFDKSDCRGAYYLRDLSSQGAGGAKPFDFAGRLFSPPEGRHWSVTSDTLPRLSRAGRIEISRSYIRAKVYHPDFPVHILGNVWLDTQFGGEKYYAVQTHTKVIERCLLMTTDPGDLVFDPTCGSGTTAYVAEKWGRRWITCDTSRVAIAIARQRLMTAVYDYYELAHPEEGVGSGFKYKTVPHVTLKSIANNPEIDDIYNRMHPAVEKALADLNAALKGKRLKFKVTTGGREGSFVDFAASDDKTFTMPSGQAVKVNELVEWEVPFEFPPDWPAEARKPFEAFHSARRAMQKEIDEAIARHADQETLYDQPLVDRKKVRVSGPFTVEAVPSPVVKSPDEILEQTHPQEADMSVARSGETLRQAEWRDELLKTGIRGKGGQYIHFSRLEPLPACTWLHADGETKEENPQRVVVSFGPEHAPLEQRQVERAWEEAQQLLPKPKLLVFAAFQFDPEASKDIDEMNPELAGMQFLKVQMNADLLTEDLKKKRSSNESFWLIGQPDVEVRKTKDGKLQVEVHGFDYYNPATGKVESGGKDKIALWMLDTDYDGRSLYPRQVFFPMAGENEGWARLARNLKAEIDEDRIEAYRGTVSLPFEPGEHKRIAVKIVDDRGIESLKVVDVE
jgi:adenine-specific DNA-methyltransferase